MPGYIKKVLQRYKHEMTQQPQRSPHPVAQIKYGKAAQDPIPEDTSREASDEEILKVQQVVGSIILSGSISFSVLIPNNKLESRHFLIYVD